MRELFFIKPEHVSRAVRRFVRGIAAIFAPLALVGLSACGAVGAVAVIGAPAVDIAQAEMGQEQSYVDDGFDWLCTEVFGGTLPRDPNTGDCK